VRIRQLEYFVHVCDTGSITRAAGQLNVAQPALGMQIKALEEELGTQLLHRTHRGTTVTPEGEIFLEEARHVVARIRDVRQRLREAKGSGAVTVTLGLTPSLATVLTSPLLEALSRTLPRIRLQIYEEFSHILIGYVENGSLDLALAYSVPRSRGLHCEGLLRETLFFITKPGSPLDRPGPIRFDELSKAEFVMSTERDFVRQIVEETMHRHERSLAVSYEVESMSAMKETVMSGLACCILPYGNLVRDVAAGTLAARPIVDPPITRTLYAVRGSERVEGANREALLDTIKSVLQQICAESPALSLLEPSHHA